MPKGAEKQIYSNGTMSSRPKER